MLEAIVSGTESNLIRPEQSTTSTLEGITAATQPTQEVLKLATNTNTIGATA